MVLPEYPNAAYNVGWKYAETLIPVNWQQICTAIPVRVRYRTNKPQLDTGRSMIGVQLNLPGA